MRFRPSYLPLNQLILFKGLNTPNDLATVFYPPHVFNWDTFELEARGVLPRTEEVVPSDCRVGEKRKRDEVERRKRYSSLFYVFYLEVL